VHSIREIDIRVTWRAVERLQPGSTPTICVAGRIVLSIRLDLNEPRYQPIISGNKQLSDKVVSHQWCAASEERPSKGFMLRTACQATRHRRSVPRLLPTRVFASMR
jgi:hypothetical protein